jgi:hypothetical protein
MGSTTITETGSSATVTANLSAASEQAVTINLSPGGTAISATSFTIPADSTTDSIIGNSLKRFGRVSF